MADKDFVVKNGLVVNTNALVVDGTNNKVGVNTASPDATLSVVGTANISGNVTLSSNLSVTGNTVLTGRFEVTNNAYVDKKLYVGNTATMIQDLPTIIQAVDNFNGFVMISSQNLSTLDDACADLITYADNTNGLSHFNDLGINNSRFDGTIHRIIANSVANTWQLGETVYQRNNAGANIAVGVIRDIVSINSTATTLKISVSEDDGLETYVGISDFVPTAGANLSLRAVTSAANSNILFAVPFFSPAANTLSRRNYGFTIGKRGDGYLYNANSALTIGTTAGGLRTTEYTLALSTFSTGQTTIQLSSGNTDLLYSEMIVTGTGIPTDAYIRSITNSTAFVLSKAVTSGSSGSYIARDPYYDSTGNPIIFHVNGMMAKNEVARITGNGNLTIGSNTTARNSKLTVAGTANITGNSVFGNNVTVAGNTTVAGTINAASVLVGANASLTTSTLQIGNATANIIANSTILKLANSSSIANLTPLDLKIGSTTVNGVQIATTTVTGNLAGSYANFSGQVNTATIYATGSANIASAVQANASGLWTTGQVNAASVTVGNSTVTNAFVANATTMFIGNSVANTTHNISLIQLANSTAIANLTPIDLKLGSTVVNTTVIQVGSVMNINTTALKIGDAANSFIANSTTLLLGNSSVNAIVNSTAVVFANTIKTVVLSPQSFQGTAQDSLKLNNQSASYYTDYSDTKAATAYTNAVSYADTKAGTAYTNAITYSGNAVLAYTNAITYSANASKLSSGTVDSARLTGAYGGVTGLGTLTLLQISGNTLGNNFSMTSNPSTSANLISFGAANVTFDTSVLAVDSINNRVGVNTTTPDASLKVSGTANVSGNVALGANVAIAGNLSLAGSFIPSSNVNPTSNNLYLGNTTNLWNFTGNNITVNKVITTNVSSSATIYVGANVVANTISIKVGDGSVYSAISNTKIETTGDIGVAGVIVTGSTSTGANSVTVSNVSIKVANSTVNATINSTAIAFVNASATAVINATNHPGTANNSTRLNGQLASYYTTYSDTKAGDAYTNAVSYVGTTLGGYALKTGTTFTGPVIVSNTVSIANTLTISNDVTINSPGKLSARIQPRVLAYASNGATPACNTDLYDMMVITNQSTSITNMSTNLTGTPYNGQRFHVAVTATSTRTISWGDKFESSGQISLPTSITTTRKDFGFVWNAATSNWRIINYA